MKRCRSCGTVWDSKKKDCPECGGANVDNEYIRSPLEDQFRAEVQKCLKPITAKMTKELRKISKKSLDEETYLIDFMVNSQAIRGMKTSISSSICAGMPCWIDGDQMDLNFPPEFLLACGQAGLEIYIVTND
jgi:hypothetical protein